MAVRRRPSYGFDLAGTAFGVSPEAGVSRSMLTQLFPELGLKATAVTDTKAEEVEKPEETPVTPTDSGLLNIGEDDTIPGSEFQKYNLKGSLSYAAPFNIQVGPTGPQGRGSRLGYSASVEDIKPPEQPATKTETPAEPTTPTTPSVQISSQYGASPAYFGHEDYWRNIEKGATPTQVKEFLEKNINLLRGENVPGAGGLYDQLTSGKVPTLGSTGSSYYQQQQPVQSPQPAQQPAPSYSISAGASSEYLGHADVEQAKAQGASNQDIARWIATNTSKLRGSNVPGAGGLYDEYARYL